MQYALIDDIKTKPSPNLKGICPGCLQSVIPRCGDQRMHHWAHKIKMCDSWGEKETEWHRNWKNKFPSEWQEVFLLDEQTGERHFADISTSHGIVIEFQHSPINPEERRSRERFYKNLIWVVNGTRLKYDYPRFLKGKNSFRMIKEGIFEVTWPEEIFPSSWLESSAPVIFDFQGNEVVSHISDVRNKLYCLFPIRIGPNVIIAEISRKAFINKIMAGDWLERINNFLNQIKQANQKRQAEIDILERLKAAAAFRNFMGLNQPRRRRRL